MRDDRDQLPDAAAALPPDYWLLAREWRTVGEYVAARRSDQVQALLRAKLLRIEASMANRLARAYGTPKPSVSATSNFMAEVQQPNSSAD